MHSKRLLSSATAIALSAVFLATAATNEGCLNAHCAALCINQVSATRTFTFTDASIVGATGRACRNAKCFDFTVQQEDATLLVCASGDGADAGGGPCVITAQADGSFSVEIHFALEDGVEPKDGDTYQFDLVSPTDPSHSLVHIDEKVEYEEYDYCGQDCYKADL